MQRGQKISPDLLPWVWAVEDQLCLLDRFDAEAIAAADEARKGKCQSLRKLVPEFRNLYALRQGQLGILLRDREEQFIDVCTRHFSSAITDTDQAQKRWKKAVDELESADGDAQRFWSATLKMFWFFHPERLPMYDRFALDGLRKMKRIHLNVRALRPTITADTFLDEFEAFFQRSSEFIDAALAIVRRPYPYRPRIAEKFLWLKGRKDEQRILERFQKGLTLAPYPN